MKVVKSALAGFALFTAITGASAFSASAQDAAEIVSEKEWVCYYDRATYQLLYCQWE